MCPKRPERPELKPFQAWCERCNGPKHKHHFDVGTSKRFPTRIAPNCRACMVIMQKERDAERINERLFGGDGTAADWLKRALVPNRDDPEKIL